MEQTSPYEFLKLKDDEYLQTCINKRNSIMNNSLSTISSEEHSDSNLPRSSSEKKSVKTRKKEDRRVSFGGKQEFVITPRESQEVPQPQTIETKELIQSPPVFLEIQNLSNDSLDTMNRRIKNFKNGYDQTMLQVKTKLGVHSTAPTTSDIENLRNENLQMRSFLKELEAELEELDTKFENDIRQEKLEIRNIQENVNEFKNSIEVSREELNKTFQKVEGIRTVFASLLSLNARIHGNSFYCEGQYNSVDCAFNIESLNGILKYKPVKTDFPAGNLLNCEIHDLNRRELPMLFIRIFRSFFSN